MRRRAAGCRDRGATDIDAGFEHTCVIDGSGSVRCWGGNSGYELGDSTLSMSSSPLTIAVSGAVDIDVGSGSAFACAVKSDASMCAGVSAGPGMRRWHDRPLQRDPRASSRLHCGTALSYFRRHNQTFARRKDGTLAAWGYNDNWSPLGIGVVGNSVATPQTVLGPSSPAKALASGYPGQCASLEDGTVWCGGAQGQLTFSQVALSCGRRAYRLGNSGCGLVLTRRRRK